MDVQELGIFAAVAVSAGLLGLGILLGLLSRARKARALRREAAIRRLERLCSD